MLSGQSDCAMNAIAGNFVNILKCERLNRWKKTRLAFIASSTFTDTKCIRDGLIEDILPRIRQIGLKNDVKVVLVDMRFVHRI